MHTIIVAAFTALVLSACTATGPLSDQRAPAAGATAPRSSPGCSHALAYSELNHGVALLVIQHGKTICEGYKAGLDQNTPHALFSGTK